MILIRLARLRHGHCLRQTWLALPFPSAGYQLVGTVVIRLDDMDAVVSEFGMGARNLILRHMTSDAVLRPAPAGSRMTTGGNLRGFGGRVAAKTAPVVRTGVARKGLVGVVAGKTGEP